MTPEEFLRAALSAGADVRYVDGEVHASIGNEVTITPPKVVAPPKKSAGRVPFSDRTAGKHYEQYREAYGTTNASVMGAAVGLLIGHRYGNWRADVETIVREAVKVDIPTLQACARAVVLLDHSINRKSSNRVSLSTSAVCAAMYAAIDAEPAMDIQDVMDVLQEKALKRVLLELDRRKVELGGPRSDNFRRESLNRFLAVMLGKEV